MRWLLILLFAVALPTPADGQWKKTRKAPASEEIEEDPLSLAALMIRDGHWDRAQRVLDGVDPSDPETDQVRFHTLAGLVAFQQERWADAVTLLSTAQALGAAEEKLGLYVALGLVELGYYQTALDASKGLLTGDAVEPWILLGEALIRARRPNEASLLLEEARLRFPDNADLTLQLAGALLKADKPLAAGMLLERAAQTHPALAKEGAECLRRAGRLQRALVLGAKVPDPAERYRQRLALLIEMEDWERAAALEGRLDRVGALEDEDDLLYAVAYARFRVGDHGAASALLTRIRDPQTFARATTLREAIAQCEAEPAACD